MPFIEITPADPSLEQTAPPLVDIVFVHGLFENAINTLTEADTDVLWLRDLFSAPRHSCRVLAYDYDRRALLRPGSGHADPLLKIATNFVQELTAFRAIDNAYRRPVIFICHGFGGLLLKRALVLSQSKRSKFLEHLRSIYVSTYAILFVGSPHQGMTEDALLVSHNEEDLGLSQLAIDLLADSETLIEITDHFMPIMKQYHVFNFWEELKTEIGAKKLFIVDMESAAPSIWADVERAGLMRKHADMLRFSTRTSPGYLMISEAIIRYSRSAPSTVENRWTEEKASLEVENRRRADELLQPQIEPGAVHGDNPSHASSIYLVPRNSSPQFTGRKRYAEELKDMLNPPSRLPARSTRTQHKIVVIYGTGGSGKTQFCLRYAEDNRNTYWGIFWIDASTRENAELGFSKLGEMAGKGLSFAAGKYWLSQCAHPWVLILDNADDPGMDIPDFFPITGGGHILITSRNPRASFHATHGDFRFRGMDPEEGVELLLNSAYGYPKGFSRDLVKEDLARRLGAEMGYLALALSQAGITIRRNIYTLEQYLRAYLGYRDSLLPNTNVKTLNAVTTWEIPLQNIQKYITTEHKDAVDLIHIIAFLHFDAIHEFIFRPSAHYAEGTDAAASNFPDIICATHRRSEQTDARLRLALEILTEHSLIDLESEDDSQSRRYSQHPVVHRWAQDRLTPEKYLSSLKCTITLLARSISPYLEDSGREARRTLIPHIESCLQRLARRDPRYPDTTEIADAVYSFALVFAECGLWRRAEELQQRVIGYRSRTFGKSHKSTLQALSALGQVYWNLFKPDLAIKVQRQIIDVKRWIWPSYLTFYITPPYLPDPISYYTSLSELALALWLAGHLELSKRLGLRATTGLVPLLGPSDPATLTAMFNLARTHLHLGEFASAHGLLVPVLRTRKHFFGPTHPDTLMVRNELGMLYCASKRHLSLAERLVRNVLHTRRRILGEEHAYTLWSINDLSRVLCERERGAEAVQILEPVVAIATRTLGARHAGTTMTKANLARAYVKGERWEEAAALLGETLGAMEKENRDWVHAVAGYVYVLMQLQRWGEAEQHCRNVLGLDGPRLVVERGNPRLVAVAEQLAQVYHATGRSEEVANLKGVFPMMEESTMVKGYRFIPERTAKVLMNESARQDSRVISSQMQIQRGVS